MDDDGSDVDEDGNGVDEDGSDMDTSSDSNDGDLKPKAKNGIMDANIRSSKGAQQGEKTNKVRH